MYTFACFLLPNGTYFLDVPRIINIIILMFRIMYKDMYNSQISGRFSLIIHFRTE